MLVKVSTLRDPYKPQTIESDDNVMTIEGNSPENKIDSEDDDDSDKDENYIPDSLTECEDTADSDEETSSDHSSVGETESIFHENNPGHSWIKY